MLISAATCGGTVSAVRDTLSTGNIFAELMQTVQHASLGQVTHALYEVGGEYRRNI